MASITEKLKFLIYFILRILHVNCYMGLVPAILDNAVLNDQVVKINDRI